MMRHIDTSTCPQISLLLSLNGRLSTSTYTLAEVPGSNVFVIMASGSTPDALRECTWCEMVRMQFQLFTPKCIQQINCPTLYLEENKSILDANKYTSETKYFQTT